MVVERRTKRDLVDELERLRERVAVAEASQSLGAGLSLFTAALEGVPSGVSISAQGGGIRWANKALEMMLGRPRSQIIGTALFDYWYHGYSESEMDSLKLLWSGELERHSYDRLLQRSDDKPFWAEVTTSIIADPSTGERWMLRVVQDDSQRQQNEEELRAHREQSHAVLESITEGVCVFRGRQRLFVNRAFVEMLGHAGVEDALRGSAADFLPDADRRRVERDEALEPGRRLEEAMVRRADGSQIHAVVSIARTVFEGLPAWVAVLRDITLRMRARLALEASERRYRSLFEAAPMGITILDDHGVIDDCNPAFEEMTGMPADQIRGHNVRYFTELPPGRKRARSFERLAAGEIEMYESERLWTAPNKNIEWVEFRTAAVRDREGRFEHAISINRDITGRKRMERQRQELYWRLAASKEEQSRELAKELHDEIGQLLTGLRLQLERGTNASTRAALEIAGELMDRVRSLSLDLRPSSLDDLGLVAALRNLIERFKDRTGVRVELKHNDADFRLAPEVGVAAFRIVQEALTNVARHSGAASATVTLTLEDEVLTARIEDRGHGTTRRLGSSPDDAESTGLSGMYERALALGGDLRFTSDPGQGAVVEAVLPINVGAAGAGFAG